MSKTEPTTEELAERVRELEQRQQPTLTQKDVQDYMGKLPVSRRQLLGAVAAGTISLPLLYADIAQASQGSDGQPYACVWLGDQNADGHVLDNLAGLNGADIANATVGEVLESNGDGTLGFAASSDLLWTKDGNSPQTTTGTTSDTYTLSGTYDEVVIHVFLEDVSGSNNEIDCRYNGDTGTNYTFVKESGNRNTGQSEVNRIVVVGANRAVPCWVFMNGRGSGEINGRKLSGRGDTQDADTFLNGTVTPPLDSVTLLGGGSFDIRWEVFGRDIGSGGVP